MSWPTAIIFLAMLFQWRVVVTLVARFWLFVPGSDSHKLLGLAIGLAVVVLMHFFRQIFIFIRMRKPFNPKADMKPGTVFLDPRDNVRYAKKLDSSIKISAPERVVTQYTVDGTTVTQDCLYSSSIINYRDGRREIECVDGSRQVIHLDGRVDYYDKFQNRMTLLVNGCKVGFLVDDQGVQYEFFADGRSVITYLNGDVQVNFADRSQVFYFADGRIRQRTSDLRVFYKDAEQNLVADHNDLIETDCFKDEDGNLHLRVNGKDRVVYKGLAAQSPK